MLKLLTAVLAVVVAVQADETLEAKTAVFVEEIEATEWYDPGEWVGVEPWMRLLVPTNEARDGGDPGDTSHVRTNRTASCFNWLRCVKQTSQRLSCSFHAFLGLLGICSLS